MISHIHHINFLVRDLDSAIQRYQQLLGNRSFTRDELAQRAVKTARIQLGETWLILVQPLDEDSIPARHLAKHGEGFFLMSLGTDNLEAEQSDIEARSALKFSSPKRKGLDDWSIIDLDIDDFFGAQIQLAQDRENKEDSQNKAHEENK